jgi:hypothetical protein
LWRCLKYIRFWLWLDCLGVLHRVIYLKWRRRIGDCMLSGMSLARVWGVVIWLVVWRRISVVTGMVFGTSVRVLVRRLVRG